MLIYGASFRESFKTADCKSGRGEAVSHMGVDIDSMTLEGRNVSTKRLATE